MRNWWLGNDSIDAVRRLTGILPARLGGIRTKMIGRLVLFLFIALLSGDQSLLAAAPAKGLHPVPLTAQTQTGEKLALYEQSHALLIGVSNYTRGWSDLENIPKELAPVKTVLEGQGFHVVSVSDPDAKTLKSAFADFINQYGYQQGNRLLFYFSGHGYSDGDYGYLVPADAPDPGQDEVGFYRKALDMNQVMAWARGIRAKHALFLFDSCFSGTVFKARDLPKKEQRYIRRATRKPVRQFITAGSAGETVPARSTFTPDYGDSLLITLNALGRPTVIQEKKG
ncbi:MAG: caspase family protein [Gammaproteobacteria bacterium]|nr:caspase family protein [Gammaproteobacteria bacterium]